MRDKYKTSRNLVNNLNTKHQSFDNVYNMEHFLMLCL